MPVSSAQHISDCRIAHSELPCEAAKRSVWPTVGRHISPNSQYVSFRQLASRNLFASTGNETITPLPAHIRRIVVGGADKQMLWVEASRCIAGMQHEQSRIEIESEPEPCCDTMDSEITPRRIVRHRRLPIALRLTGFRPDPAPVVVDSPVRKQPLFQDRALHLRLLSLIAVVWRRLVEASDAREAVVSLVSASEAA